MMTLMEAKAVFIKKYPDRVISESFKHPKGYLFIASKKGINPMFDYTDPYFLVNEKTGNIIGYIPSQHFDEYESVMSNRL